MPSTTIRLSEEESRLIKSYAVQERRTVSDVIRLAILDRIEDEYDLALFRQAKKEFEKDPVTYSHEEIMAEFGLND
jgi:predicted DNA-binding protein